ncbi:MAG: hypothetical protein IT428_06680 [Planctomycetaceae bacterium]|nr:hypothetical protein [Planctomycetaceae bacterium]
MTTHAATTDHENILPGETRIIECDSLVGRMRDICRGHDDAGNPVLTVRQCNAYRREWGLDELPNAEPTAKVHKAKFVQTNINERPRTKPAKPWRKPGDRIRGLGDVLALVLHWCGIRPVVKAVTKATGRSCGCQQRQDALNRLVPFGGGE